MQIETKTIIHDLAIIMNDAQRDSNFEIILSFAEEDYNS
ncbi:hypothetical protein QG37_06534 [Candidozyma auris]|uniref:Uncharacterized protein n=1 Tax=Candidozyma auris TaxID=498019 RepID=A0A0L0NSV2_CANAR|nr:hypothetical protein QG37_06534 [[Candida] auris]